MREYGSILRLVTSLLPVLLLCPHRAVDAFASNRRGGSKQRSPFRNTPLRANAGVARESSSRAVEDKIKQLKKVLYKEYVSFFDPMESQYYSKGVSFEDPMTSLEGVDSYRKNVDMLASRTLMGKFLFQDAGIVLHSVEGGEVDPASGSISDIITRWTLRVTAKVLPWKPTARFTGISVYEVSQGGSEGVVIDHQTDYWDSINIGDNGSYQKVDKSIAVKDFLDQLKSDSGNAAAAGVELPYQLLRRGSDYEIRRYPSYTAVKIPYDRRDEGYDVLASITRGVEPLAPSLMVVSNDEEKKTMSWPLVYTAPGESAPPKVPQPILDRGGEDIETVGSKVMAVGSFSDASVGPVVRRADRQLRESLARDGITVPTAASSVRFAQYDAIFSLGKRRGEVWIDLDDGSHPY